MDYLYNKFKIKNRLEEYTSFVLNNSWIFTGEFMQNIEAKAVEITKNANSTKGTITETLVRIENEVIPNTLVAANDHAIQLLTDFNGGYVIKQKDISDNTDLGKVMRLWCWNINSENDLNWSL